MKIASTAVSRRTQTLARYIAHALVHKLPPQVVEQTKHHLLDTVAAMISGTKLAPGRTALEYVKTLGGNGDACVPGTGIVTSAVNAAFAGGVCAHADETDDYHERSNTHPGAAIV